MDFTLNKYKELLHFLIELDFKNPKVSLIKSVNSNQFSNILYNNNIHYVTNSGNQIYRKKILKDWSGKIINRHSSLLPYYGGIYPIFWQMLNNEKAGGVTLHWINEYIDKGSLAYQASFKIKKGNTLFLNYKMAFDISKKLCNQMINDLKNGIVKKSKMQGEGSYYFWPKKKDIDKYKKLGNKIV